MKTSNRLFIEERLGKILDLVFEKGKVTVEEANRLLGVSPDTIRRDFTRLSKKGLVVRTHGGIMSRDGVSFDPAMKEKIVRNQKEKESIAERAALLVVDSEIIILDAGTSTERMVKHIAGRKDLTVLTDALNIAVEATKRDINTIILGGMIRNSTLCITGPDAVEMTQHYHADKLFLGVSAISLENGLMTPNGMEAEIKKKLMTIATEIIVLADYTKINRTALYSFGSLTSFSKLITNANADPEFLERLRRNNIEVIVTD